MHARTTFRSALLALALLVVPSPMSAQDPVRIQQDSDALVLPAGVHEVRGLVNETARFLGRNILLEQREVAEASSIELQTPMRIDRKQADEVLAELLYARGLVLVPRDPERGTYEVLSLRGPRAREALNSAPTRTVDEILARENLKQPVQTVVTLQFTNANIATNALRPFFASNQSGGLTLGNAGNSTSIVLCGIQSEVSRAIRLIRTADVKPSLDVDLQTTDAGARIAALEKEVAALTARIAELEKSKQKE